MPETPPRLPLVARFLLVVALLCPLALAIPELGRTRVERAIRATPPPTTRSSTWRAADHDAVDEPLQTPTLSARAALAGRAPYPILGWALNCHRIPDLPAYLRAVDDIAALGVNTLMVVTPMYQRDVGSSAIAFDARGCPTDEQLVALIERGRQHGLFTVLMPIVLLEKPGPKEWRGVIRPDDWNAWWSSYEAMIDRFTTIAVRAGADMLSIGSELNTTESQLDRWSAIVERVRLRFDGLLTYSSNWDRFGAVELWSLVDVMSVSSYFELERDRPGAPTAAIAQAWAPVRRDLVEHARRVGKPLLLSELGYPTLPWANAHPWNYVGRGTAPDHDAQARCWEAFFVAWQDEWTLRDSPIAGFCGYRWDPDHDGGDDDTGYGLVGKPSHGIVRTGIRSIRDATAD